MLETIFIFGCLAILARHNMLLSDSIKMVDNLLVMQRRTMGE